MLSDIGHGGQVSFLSGPKVKRLYPLPYINIKLHHNAEYDWSYYYTFQLIVHVLHKCLHHVKNIQLVYV